MTHTNTIRQASVADIPRIIDLLHQVYLFGAAVQLKRMGYHMTRI